jgi:hypothetical protein
MKLLGTSLSRPKLCEGTFRHQFVIGPLRDSPFFPGKARLYYCLQCRWEFLVCGSRVAILDERGILLIGAESSARFDIFEESPCPVLTAFIANASIELETAPMAPWRKYNESGDLATGKFPARAGRPRPLFRVFSRLREDLGRRP